MRSPKGRWDPSASAATSTPPGKLVSGGRVGRVEFTWLTPRLARRRGLEWKWKSHLILERGHSLIRSGPLLPQKGRRTFALAPKDL